MSITIVPRALRVLAGLAVLVLALAACGDDAGSDGDADGDPETAEETAGDTPTEDGSPTAGGSPTEGTPGEAAGGDGPPAGEEEVTFDVYMGFAEEDVIATAEEFFANVEEASEGLITFEVTAGTESISPFESFDPLARGVYDFAVSSTVYFTDQVPEPMVDMVVTNPEEQIRQTELLDLFNETLEPHGAYMLGWTGSGNQFMLIGNATLEGADFSGLNIRTFPAINGFILDLGGSPVTVPAPERYSALERGVVDLTVAPIPSIAQERLYEVSDYAIYPPFLQVREAFLFNLEAWEGLTDYKRQVLEEQVLAHEAYARELRAQQSEEALQLIRENTEAVELSEEEAAAMRESAFESTLDFMAEQSGDPEMVERIRAVLEELVE
jgi:TRAP-type C4-dicarboxylate transport system substrate-binding protein